MALSPAEYADATEIFHRALEHPPAERERFLASTSMNDAVRAEVETLLADAMSWEQAERSDTERESTVRVGPYRLVSLLGRGGMGVVHLAEQDEPIRRRVALKLLHRGFDSKGIVARFEAERQALALMEHPNIARVIDAGSTEDGQPYFVLEYIEGEPITALAERERWTIDLRIEVLLQVIAAIDHAHKKGIIHRDLKPSNVLVTRVDGKPSARVIDFGIAKSVAAPLSSQAALTLDGERLGTPEYMSPEQASGRTTEIDTRTDVWALGLILYELVAGALPFDRSVVAERGLAGLFHAICDVEAPRPSIRVATHPDKARIASDRSISVSGLVRTLRDDVDWIALAALEKNPDDRYASVREFSDDLRRYLVGEPVRARAAHVSYRMAKWSRRHRRALWTTALVVLGGVSAFLFAGAREDAERVRSGNREIERGDEARATWKSERNRVERLRGEWQSIARRSERWAPAWKRREELGAWQTWKDAERDLPRWLQESQSRFQNALATAPPGSATQARAREALFDLWVETLGEIYWGEKEALRPEYFESIALTLRDASYAERLVARKKAHIALTSEPPGAIVRCYRYETSDGRSVPVPYDPHEKRAVRSGERRGVVVDRTWKQASVPFRPGDRIVGIEGVPITVESDFVRSLDGRRFGESVAVEFERDGRIETTSWKLDAGDEEPGSTIELSTHDAIRTALGITLEAYALERTALAIGTTTPERELEIELDEGSYLLVLSMDGFEPARVPVRAPLFPGDGENGRIVIRTRLHELAEIPPGFLFVPPGRCAVGGDDQVHQALPRSYPRVEGFFIARHELTIAEYLEFLNDDETLGRDVDPTSGSTTPRLDAVREIIASSGGEPYLILPMSDRTGRPLVARIDGRWSISYRAEPDWPIFGVSLLAAMEYADWRTRKSAGRWRFRLPTDLEWEKAARGVDGRPFVWGEYPIWGYCRSSFGQLRGGTYSPTNVGAYPNDESVYGVRDLAGSVQEVTTDRVSEIFHSTRGGDWFTWNDYTFRAANRDGNFAWKTSTNRGFRLVADPPAEAERR
jgi:serine/threonine protein kinase/formylglycine-generating enzyme required for sulfatase activity